MKKMLYILVFLTLFIGIERINAYTEYKIGDVVPYNGIDFYVIKNSDSKEDTVTMLKAEPLTVAEVNEYGVGHVNRYTYDSIGTAYDKNGYGGMAYYSSETCGYVNNNWLETGCTTDYDESEVKYVVDVWKAAKAPAATEARLITKDEIETERKEYDPCGGCGAVATGDFAKYNWMYNNNCGYWTMSPYNDSASRVWLVGSDGRLGGNGVGNHGLYVVRPVITLKKTALGDIDESIVDDNIEKEDSRLDTKDNIDDNKSNESKATVKVANTYMSSSIIIIILGFIIACVSVFVLYKVRNKSIK